MESLNQKYWHDVEEIAEEAIELKESLLEEQEGLEKLEEFLEECIKDSKWVCDINFCIKVFDLTKNLTAYQSSDNDWSSDPFSFLSSCCMLEDVRMIMYTLEDEPSKDSDEFSELDFF
jgi:hypothetical protein